MLSMSVGLERGGIHPKTSITSKFELKVMEAVEAAVKDHRYVSASDLFIGMGWLSAGHVHDWRVGRTAYLERVVQANLKKISRAMKIFRMRAIQCGLKPSETAYLARTRGPRRVLQFSKSGDPDIERAYRTHFISPELSEKKRIRLQEKLDRPPQVECILQSWKCSTVRPLS